MNARTHKDAILAESLGQIGEIEAKLNQLGTQIDEHKSAIEEISTRWSDDCIEKTNRILNAAVVANKNAIDRQIRETLTELLNEIEAIQKEENTQRVRFGWLLQILVLANAMILAGFGISSFLITN